MVQVIEGTVSDAAVRTVSLTVEPWAGDGESRRVEASVPVRDGRFRAEAALAPRLNVIRVALPDRRVGAGCAVYRRPAGTASKKVVPPDQWGGRSPVVFTAPGGLKVTAAEIPVEGVVTDPEIREVEIVTLDVTDFLDDATAAEGTIGYACVRVEGMKFAARVRLREGLNMVLAKPLGAKGEVENIRVKTVVYEAVSAGIELDEPLVEAGELTVRGRIAGVRAKEVRIKVECLVEEELRGGKIRPHTVVDEEVKVGAGGEFVLRARLRSDRYRIVSPPSIIAAAGGAVATKTLVRWR